MAGPARAAAPARARRSPDYYKEGVDKAEVKARHRTRLAQVIGKALGKELKAKMITHSLTYITK
jgi:hypothetical protein